MAFTRRTERAAADRARLPCPTCPWRVDRDATTIPGYDQAKACGLTATVGEGDAFRPVMACHGSADDAVRPCLGYLARAGWSNLNVRVMVALGKIADPGEVADACARYGVDLEPDYPSVLAKLAASGGRGVGGEADR